MKVPYSWLKEYVDIDITAQELEERLFSCGFEVEELIDMAAGIDKVVVGVVTEAVPQEGTHLHICKVDCGEYGHDIQICVCWHAHPRCTGRLHAARRHPDQGPQADGRAVQRHAVLRHRAGPE